MNDTLIFYEFSRSKVERGDFSHFLSLYSVDKLPTNRRLRDMMGSMVFCIQGLGRRPARNPRYPRNPPLLPRLPRRLAILALLLQSRC
jgi:hypothetical protein